MTKTGITPCRNTILQPDIGHFILDAIGFIPAIGEYADFANAIWYIRQKNYTNAILSLLSLIPEAGDLVFKGIKYLNSTTRFLKFWIKDGKRIIQYWRMIRKVIIQSEQLIKYIPKDILLLLDNKIIELTKREITDEAKPIT